MKTSNIKKQAFISFPLIHLFSSYIRFSLIRRIIIILGLILLTAGCTITDVAEPDTIDIKETDACELNQFTVITLNRDQGDQIQWSPDGRYIGFIGQSATTSRDVGNLNLAEGPDFASSTPMAEWVIGGLIWSPDGNQIAYTKLRNEDKKYTIAISQVNSNETIDLFPGVLAATDAWASPKKTTVWATNRSIQVDVMCGPGCVETYLIDPIDGSKTSLGQVYKKTVWEKNDLAAMDKPEPPLEMIDPVQSPSRQLTAFFDTFGRVNLLREGNPDPFLLRTEPPPSFPVADFWSREIKWWKDERLAVRINDELTIYDIPCALAVAE
jgi:hypothetical protein